MAALREINCGSMLRALGVKATALSRAFLTGVGVLYPDSGNICSTHLVAIGGRTLVVVDQLKNIGEQASNKRATWIHTCKFDAHGVHIGWTSVELRDVAVCKIAFVAPLVSRCDTVENMVSLIGSFDDSDDGMFDIRADYTLDGTLVRVVKLSIARSEKDHVSMLRAHVDGASLLALGKSCFYGWPVPYVSGCSAIRRVIELSSQPYLARPRMGNTDQTARLVRRIIETSDIEEASGASGLCPNQCQYISNDGNRLFVVYGSYSPRADRAGGCAMMFVFDAVTGQPLAEPYSLEGMRVGPSAGSNCFCEDGFGSVCFATENGCAFWQRPEKTLSLITYEQLPGRGVAVPLLVGNGVVLVITIAETDGERCLVGHIIKSGTRNAGEQIAPFGPPVGKFNFNRRLRTMVSIGFLVVVVVVLLLNFLATLKRTHEKQADPEIVKIGAAPGIAMLGVVIKPYHPNLRPI